jgi:hypothetical protein
MTGTTRLFPTYPTIPHINSAPVNNTLLLHNGYRITWNGWRAKQVCGGSEFFNFAQFDGIAALSDAKG